MLGYSREELICHTSRDIHFIRKPYSLGCLAEKVLEALNEDKKGAEKHLFS